MSQLPLIKSKDPSMDLLQTKWKSNLDPILSIPFLSGKALTNIILATGINNIYHGLGETQQGWIIIDQTASAAIYRSQPFNKQNLTLTSSAPVTISLWVF